MSVINKMLRDLDSRQGNPAALGGVGAVRPGQDERMAGISTVGAGRRGPNSTARLWRTGAAVVVLLLTVAVAGWWAQRALPSPDKLPQPTHSVAAVPPQASPVVAPPQVQPAAAAPRMAAAPATVTSTTLPLTPPPEVRTAAVLPPASPAKVASPAASSAQMVTAAPVVTQQALPLQPPAMRIAPAAQTRMPASATVSASQGLNLKPTSGTMPTPDRPASKPALAPSVLAQATPPAQSAPATQPTPATQSAPAAAQVWPAAVAPSALAKPAPQAAFDLVAQARTLYNEGERSAALLLLKGALQRLEAAPAGAAVSDTASVAALAREYAHQTLASGQPTEALATLERLEPRLAGVADIWAIRGNAAQRLGLHTQAVSAYQQALALSPNEPRWLLGAAVSLAALGQTGAAAELAEKVRAARALPADVANYLRQLGVPLRAD